ncbi:MAG: flagellin [Agathobacter sp.]|nr:flagellin [Agathobacter sp.]
MKINRNMSAVIASNQLHRTENKLSVTMERLSTGLKLNSAEDSPAGMAISNKMKAQIDALDKASDNSTDAISVMEIADGALNEVTSIIQRMRELSVQAASGIYTYDDKSAIQSEIAQLRDEVDRVSSNTEFNTKSLLDGSSDTRVYTRKSVSQEMTYSDITRINISDEVDSKHYKVEVTEVAKQAQSSISGYPAGGITEDGTISINGVSAAIKAGTSEEDYLAQVHDLVEQAGANMKVNGNSIDITSKKYGSASQLDISISDELANALGYTTQGDGYTDAQTGTDAKVTAGDGFTHPIVTYEGNRVYISDDNGFKMDFMVDASADLTEYDIDVTDIGTMTIQIGANQYQEMDLRIPEVSAQSLYLDEIDVAVAGGADKALGTLDNALSQVNSVRSRIGAFQNRLEYANASLDETSENMTSAYSTLTDTDMATEMTEYASQNILNQAGISVLSQANDLPQQVLSLLSR